MVDASRIRSGLAVVASDAEPVGSVDAVDGDRVKLTRPDPADHIQHDIPLTWVERVDERVHLNRTGAEVRTSWAPPRAKGAVAKNARGAHRTSWLPWILLGLALLALLGTLGGCGGHPAAAATVIIEATPDGPTEGRLAGVMAAA